MAGNLPVTLTTFETELQAKINTVGGATSIEDIISYYRAGENIPTINNTALTAEVQSRLDAVSSATTAEEFLTLAASFGKISNTNQSDLQSALLAIADIPTNSELATALTPIATSANVSDSEAAILTAISGVGGGAFKATAMLATQSYSLSAATSPLVLTPPSGKVIRLDALNAVSVPDLEIKIGSSILISGRLSPSTSGAGTFNINSPAESTDTATSSRFKTGVKDPVVAYDKDQSISIETTNVAAVDIYYSVSYGDL